ncbi:Ethanolamine utilization protein EutN [Planctomycetales bacterium 10988]|nr:Ethanolamine utilization protein EutN [Planctomycetales bacterium 10988]
MILGKVCGLATSSVKHPSISGWKLLCIQPLLADKQSPDGYPLLAIDSLGARIGEQVILTSDGKYIRELLGRDDSPVRWTVLGFPDS